MNIQTILKLVTMALLAVFVTSCAGVGALSRSDRTDRNNVAPSENDRDVLLAAIAKNQQTLATKMDSNVDKGLRVRNTRKNVERDTKGEIIVLEDGSIVYGEADLDLSLSTFHELANSLQGFELEIGTQATAQAGTNQVYGTPAFDALRLTINNAGGASLNADNLQAQILARAIAKETAGRATAEVIKARFEGWKGLTVTLANGATGILREVNRVTPMGLGSTAVELALEKDDGTVIEAIEKVPVTLEGTN